MTAGVGTTCNCLTTGTLLNLPDEDRSGLYRARDYWSYMARGPQTKRSYPFFELWQQSGFSSDLAMQGNTWDDIDEFASYDNGESGKFATYYIKGQIIDLDSLPIGGVVVNCFRSSDNLFVGTTRSDSSGNYMVSTPYPGVSHFVVAYLADSPDREGTTVNNLTPTVS